MTTQHTPGPWRYEQHGEACRVVGADGTLICNTAGWSIEPDVLARECENSRLIAAAPELLAALRQALDYLPALAEHLELSEMPGHAGNVTVHIKRMHAALAKAEGR